MCFANTYLEEEPCHKGMQGFVNKKFVFDFSGTRAL